jgi:hypothetical protein
MNTETTTAYDRLNSQDELAHGDIAAERQDSLGGFLVGTLADLQEVKASGEVPMGRIFRVIGEGEDQHTEPV